MNIEKQLRNIAKQEGIKNPDDIFDLSTFEDIKELIGNSEENVEESLSEEMPDKRREKCLKEARFFCADVSSRFQERFISLIESYRKEQSILSQEIIDYLLKKKFDLPEFAIMQGVEAENFISEMELNNLRDKDNIVINFQLPKPLAHFWWKGGEDSWGMLGERATGTIEWGHFYRELMQEVWSVQGEYENEHGIGFSRLNDIGQHDPKKYYYVWEVNSWED